MESLPIERLLASHDDGGFMKRAGNFGRLRKSLMDTCEFADRGFEW